MYFWWLTLQFSVVLESAWNLTIPHLEYSWFHNFLSPYDKCYNECFRPRLPTPRATRQSTTSLRSRVPTGSVCRQATGELSSKSTVKHIFLRDLIFAIQPPLIDSQDFILVLCPSFFDNLYIRIIGEDFIFASLCSCEFTQKLSPHKW